MKAFSPSHRYKQTRAEHLYSGGHENYNVGRPFLGHQMLLYTYSLSDLCSAVEKRILKEVMHFPNMTNMAIYPVTQEPLPMLLQFR